jgi:hypothetical protein
VAESYFSLSTGDLAEVLELDRLMHRAAMLEFDGKSYRLREAAARIAIAPAGG